MKKNEDKNKTQLKNLTSVEKDNGNIVVGKKDSEKYIHVPFNKKDKYFSNPVDFISFIKATEVLVRTSREYNRYIALLKNEVGLRSCALFHNIDDSIAPIEMHHGPIFTLHDIIEIQISNLYQLGEPINSSNVAHYVLKDHFDNIIQIVMLCKMAHVGVHNFNKSKDKRYFLNVDGAFGDFKKFVIKYNKSFTLSHINKIKHYLKLYEEYSSNNNHEPMFKESITEWSEIFK